MDLENKIYFDMGGNLYFGENDYNNAKSGQVCINKLNVPYIDYGKYPIIKWCDDFIYGKLRLYKKESLKQQTINKIKDDCKNDPDNKINITTNCYSDNTDYAQDAEYEYTQYENGFFGTEMNDLAPSKFYFLQESPNCKIPIMECEIDDINALYETLIYKNNKLCFKTQLEGEESLFRIHLYLDAIPHLQFEINESHHKLKKYKIECVDDKIVFT
jgi:hypothetical protein